MKTIVIDGKHYIQVKPDSDRVEFDCPQCAFGGFATKCRMTVEPAKATFGGDCAETNTVYQEVMP